MSQSDQAQSDVDMQQTGNVIGNAADIDRSPDEYGKWQQVHFSDFHKTNNWLWGLDKINYLNSPSNRRGNNDLEGGQDDLDQDEGAEGSEEEPAAEMNEEAE